MSLFFHSEYEPRCLRFSAILLVCSCSSFCFIITKIWLDWMNEWTSEWFCLKGWAFPVGSLISSFCCWGTLRCEMDEQQPGCSFALPCSKGAQEGGWSLRNKRTVLWGQCFFIFLLSIYLRFPQRLVEFVFRITWHALKAIDFRANTMELLYSLLLI